MSLETEIALGMAGALVGTLISVLFCLWILDRRNAQLTRFPAVPRCVMRVQNGAATICAWCPDAKEGNAYAETFGLMPTHSLCPTCRTKHFPELKKAFPQK